MSVRGAELPSDPTTSASKKQSDKATLKERVSFSSCDWREGYFEICFRIPAVSNMKASPASHFSGLSSLVDAC